MTAQPIWSSMEWMEGAKVDWSIPGGLFCTTSGALVKRAQICSSSRVNLAPLLTGNGQAPNQSRKPVASHIRFWRPPGAAVASGFFLTSRTYHNIVASRNLLLITLPVLSKGSTAA